METQKAISKIYKTNGSILLLILGMSDWGQDYGSYYELLSMLGKVIVS